jgi:hypothetical protein
MGCYELLPSNSNAGHGPDTNTADLQHTHASTAAAATSKSIPLWTPHIGRRFVQRYQRYLEHEQQQHDAEGAPSTPSSHHSSAFNAFILTSAVHQQQQLQHDEEQPYMLGSYLNQLQTSEELPAGIAEHHSSNHTLHTQHPHPHPQQQAAGLLAAGKEGVRGTKQQQQQHGLQVMLHKALGIGGPAKPTCNTTR